MKTIFKRLTSLLFVVCMCVTLLPLMANEAEADITVFLQGDSRWGSHQYGYSNSEGTTPATIKSGGCGILSYVNAVYYLNGNFIQPIELADYSVKYGYRINGVGTSYELYKSFANNRGDNYGIKYIGEVNTYSELKSKLLQGMVAICGKPGHIMACVDYDASTQKYLILDSAPNSNRGTSSGYAWKTQDQMQAIGIRTKFYILASTSSAPTYANPGDSFTAPIINRAPWTAGTGSFAVANSYTEGDKPPVRIQKESGSSEQLWYFTRQSDGSYKICSGRDGKYLDVRNAVVANGTPIITRADNGSDAQKWYLKEEGGGYVIISKLNTNYVLDLNGGNTTPGTNIQLWEYNGTAAQIWAIYRGDECTLKGPKNFAVSASTTLNAVKFTWEETYGETGYAVKIWKDKQLWDGDSYHTEWDAKSGYSLKLPAGTYAAYVDSYNAIQQAEMSNSVTFTVTQHTCSYSSRVTSPTCTAQGYTTYTCSACGNSYKGNTKSALGHSYSYSLSKTPTTSAAGSLYGKCTRCSATTYVTLPKLNTGDYTYSLVSAATYTSAGTGRYTWKTTSYGTYRFDVTIPKLNNVFSYTVAHWTLGYVLSEGNNSTLNAVNIGYDNYTSIYGSTFELNSSKAVSLPNGFYLNAEFGTPHISGAWGSYPMGTVVTQKAENMHFEYYYSPYTYTITYNLDGGTNNTANPSTYNVLYGVTLQNPTKEGFIFTGWKDESGNIVTGINQGKSASFATNATYSQFCAELAGRITGNQTLTATWRLDHQDIGTDIYVHIYQKNTKKYVTQKPDNNIYGADYTGNGNQVWKLTRHTDGSYIITNAVTGACLTVQDASLESGTTIYAYDGGYVGQSQQRFYICKINGAYYLSPAHCTSTKMMFDMDIDEYYVTIWPFVYGVPQHEYNIVIADYAVKYNSNGGSGAPASQTKAFGTSVTLSTQKPTRSHYDFIGWNTAADGSGVMYYAGGIYSVDSNVVLYAQWKHKCASENSYKYNITTEPTADNAGVLTVTCSVCKKSYEVVMPSLSSAEYTYSVVSDATCTENGVGRLTWTENKYGTYYFDTVIDKTGHSYKQNIVAPGYITEGYTVNTCVRCGNSYNSDYVPQVSVTIGEEFYAIVGCDNGAITNDNDGNVRNRSVTEYANQVWKFVLQDDGSYVIYSAFDGKMISYSVYPISCVKLIDSTEINDNVKWYLIEHSGVYVISSKCGSVVGSFIIDNNVNISSVDATDIATWIVTKTSYKASGFNVIAGDEDNKTVFSWDNTVGALRYDLYIKEVSGSEYVLKNVSSPYSILLPKSTYETYIEISNGIENVRSNTIDFEVLHAHNYYSVITTEPTCTAGGYTEYKCDCGYMYRGDHTEALEHSYSAVVTDPDCESQGYTTYTCTRCDDSYKDNYVDLIGHTYENGICKVCQAGATAAGLCGENVTWSLSSDGTLVISGTGEMYDYEYVSRDQSYTTPWYEYVGAIKRIIIEDGVTTIGKMAFAACKNFSTVEIADSVKSLGTNSFTNSTSLIRVDLPKNLTEIGDGVFLYCKNLEYVSIPNSVTIVGEQVFMECEKLKTAGPVGGDYNITFEWKDTIPSIFHQASYLESIEIPDSVTSLGSFYYCWRLQGIKLPESLKTLGSFQKCSGLARIEIPNGVTSIGGGAFNGCRRLEEIVIPETVKTIGDQAFANCYALKSITIPKSVTSIGKSVFSLCSNLIDIIVDSDNKTYTDVDGVLFSKDLKNLISLPAGRSGKYTVPVGTVTIGGSAFFGCQKITEIYIPDGVTTIGSSVFGSCHALKKLTVPASLVNIHMYTFNSSLKLESAGPIGSGCDYEFGWTEVIPAHAFEECSKLKKVILPEGIKNIGSRAFQKMGWLKTITIPESVQTINSDSFRYSECLSCIYIDSVNIASYATTWCSYARSIAVRSDIPTIGSYITDNYTKISNITYDGKEYVVYSDHEHTWTSEVYLEPVACISDGLTLDTCSTCKLMKNEIISCHTMDHVDAMDPACNHVGWYEHDACIGCGFSLNYIEISALPHTTVVDKAKAPTCTETGLTEGSHCSVCGNTITEQKIIEPLGHSVVVDKAVSPTCIATGLTEGKHCSVCDTVLVKQEIVTASGHVEVVDSAVSSTCTKSGLTEGKHCRVCGEITVKQNVVAAHGHSEVTDAAIDATCTEDGLTLGKHCETCGEILEKQNVIKAQGHNAVADKSIAPNCTQTGLTEGSHCSVCDEVIESQNIVAALGHSAVVDKATSATCTESGLAEGSHCSVCGEILEAQVVLKELGHNYIGTVTNPTCTTSGFTLYVCDNPGCYSRYVSDTIGALGHIIITNSAVQPTCTDKGYTEGKYCAVCDDVITERKELPALGHTVIMDSATAATCLTDGLTEGSHCAVCDAVIIEQTVIKALGHDVIDHTNVEATCTVDGYSDFVECSRCDFSTKTIHEAIGHTEVIDYEVFNGCTENGLTEGSHCSTCGEVFKAQETTYATGHEYSDWFEETSPTCNTVGEECRYCDNCDHYETREVVALGHDFASEWTVDVEPTTTTTGQKSRHCSRCDEVTDIIEISKKVEIIDTSKKFTDIVDSWSKPSIDYVVSYGYMNGTGNGSTFSPSGTMSRSMIVTVLYRIAGQPSHSGYDPFTDITTGWYYDAVLWAYENGIVTGTSKTTFAPDGAVTREQMATFLYRFAKYMGYDVSTTNNISMFPDANKVGSWAYDALAWANAEGLITGAKGGDGVTRLDPQGNATREQVATILMRFCKAFE